MQLLSEENSTGEGRLSENSMKKNQSFFGVPEIFWTLFSIRTINSIGFSATLPFLGVYLLVVRDVPLTEIGLLYLASGVLRFASQIFSGRLTDAIGPKKVMQLGYLSSLITSLILGYLISLGASVPVFFILYPLFALFRSISQPATSAIIANQELTKVRTGFAFLNIGGNLGFAIGPAVAGIIIDSLGYSFAFYLSAAVAGIAAIITLFKIESGRIVDRQNQIPVKSTARPNSWLSWKKDQNLIVLLGLILCMFICIGYEITPMSLYVASVAKFSNTLIGYLFATNGLTIVILQLPITRLIEKSRVRLLLPLVFSAGFATVSFVMAVFARSFLQWELFMIVITLGEIMLTVPSQSVISFFSKAENRGTYQGYYSAVSNSGRSLASYIGPTSLAFFAFDPSLMWATIGALGLATGIGFALLSPKIQKDYEVIQNVPSLPTPTRSEQVSDSATD
jgi:DHA1 family multidrug resistance protein B-like MFS transporter